MATYTQLTSEQARLSLRAFGLEAGEVVPIVAGTVNSNYRVETGRGRSVFVRIYEEQSQEGAEAEARMLAHFAGGDVQTPCPLPRVDRKGFTVLHEDERSHARPLAVFPWREGESLCQRLVTPRASREVGAALARIHLVGRDFQEARCGRYRIEDLRERLVTIAACEREELAEMAPRIADKLDRAASERDEALPAGIIHGDLFRDNVLWQEGKIVALLDFESASSGGFAYDLMVTALAWCHGDDLDLGLVRAMLEGYERVRPLTEAERRALSTEAKIAALRFTITRITDVAMRAKPGEVPKKDWRRFWARHERVEALEKEGFDTLLR